jgi:Mn-dependent DtxR family transcriptional regulator
MLQLRSTVDQMLTELERRGLISLTPDKLHG